MVRMKTLNCFDRQTGLASVAADGASVTPTGIAAARRSHVPRALVGELVELARPG